MHEDICQPLHYDGDMSFGVGMLVLLGGPSLNVLRTNFVSRGMYCQLSAEFVPGYVTQNWIADFRRIVWI